MTLGFSTHFQDGSPTQFQQKILLPYRPAMLDCFPDLLPKIHTFREGKRWRAGIKMHLVVNNHTPQRYQFGKDIPELEYCKSVQDCTILCIGDVITIFIDGTPLTTGETMLFLTNEGFPGPRRFVEWFGHPFKEMKHEGQIVHFSNFRYQ